MNTISSEFLVSKCAYSFNSFSYVSYTLLFVSFYIILTLLFLIYSSVCVLACVHGRARSAVYTRRACLACVHGRARSAVCTCPVHTQTFFPLNQFHHRLTRHINLLRQGGELVKFLKKRRSVPEGRFLKNFGNYYLDE